MLACVFFGWALSLPQETTATRSTLIDAPQELVFRIATDVGNQAAWRSDVADVRVFKGGVRWIETTSQGFEITFVEQAKDTERYVISYESAQGFSGQWEGRFTAEGDATRAQITETTQTIGLLRRAMARIFAPPGSHIDLWLNDLTTAAEDAL